MKRLLSTILILAALALIWLLSPWSPVASTLMVGSSHEDCQAAELPALYVKGEEALRYDDLKTARECLARGLKEAADSDEYYRYVVLQTKCHFYSMQADSFLITYYRLKQYLDRQTRKNVAQRMLQVESDVQMGVYLAKMVGQADSAQVYNFKALRQAEQLPCCDNDRLLILSNIADSYKQMGDYDKSVEYYRAAMELGDTLVMSDATRITLTSGIASAYSAMRSFQESSVWWNRASELEPRMSFAERFHYLNNRGNDYFLQADYQKSLECFLRLDSLLQQKEDMVWERMFCYCNLSAVHIKLGNLDKALPLLNQSEQFFARQQQAVVLYYLTTQRIEMAILSNQLAEAGRLATEHPTPTWMIPEQVLLRKEALIQLYEQTGQWQLLAEEMKSHEKLSDSIASDNVKMRFSETLMRYEHEKTLIAKQHELEEQTLSFRWTLALLIGSLLLVVLLSSVIVLRMREQKMKDSVTKSRIQSLRMEVVRNRITPHFIGNALSAEMMAQAEGHEVNFDAIVELLHRGIELTGTELTSLSDELEFIEFYCSIESRSVGPDFRYQTQIAPDVDTTKVVLPAMSLQILVENAIKHGLKGRKPVEGEQRTVSVVVSKRGDATLIEVIDNGVGLAEGWQDKRRTGLRVVRQTMDMLNEQNKEHIDFGLENRSDVTGCRAWLLLPDHFDYKLKTV